MPLFIEDLHRIGNPMIEIEKAEGENWSQQMDYVCIRLQFCRLDRATLLRYYYQLGEKLAEYNWNAYAKKEMRDRFTPGRFKNALRVARRTFALYHVRGAHNLL